MFWLGLFLTFLAAPFWESENPSHWTDEQLRQLLIDSPWAQIVEAPGKTSAPAVQVYLATAAPLEEAERERDSRAKRRQPPGKPPVEDPLAEEYRAWLNDNHDSQIVVAIRISDVNGLSDAKETKIMEEECVMRAGRKKFKITGHFPPSPSDPYLRLAFPRKVVVEDKVLRFDLYLPGVAIPYREVEFRLVDMVVRGRLEL
jgi:hypothetical protein